MQIFQEPSVFHQLSVVELKILLLDTPHIYNRYYMFCRYSPDKKSRPE